MAASNIVASQSVRPKIAVHRHSIFNQCFSR
jgi:hypothetical protein